jgi:hypothetical protein
VVLSGCEGLVGRCSVPFPWIRQNLHWSSGLVVAPLWGAAKGPSTGAQYAASAVWRTGPSGGLSSDAVGLRRVRCLASSIRAPCFSGPLGLAAWPRLRRVFRWASLASAGASAAWLWFEVTCGRCRRADVGGFSLPGRGGWDRLLTIPVAGRVLFLCGVSLSDCGTVADLWPAGCNSLSLWAG